MKLLLKISFSIFAIIITVGKVQSSTVETILQKETSYSLFQESQLGRVVFESYPAYGDLADGIKEEENGYKYGSYQN